MDNKSRIAEQFIDNLGIMSKDEFATLENAKVLVVGLGGLGGNFAAGLVRLGVINLMLVDYDRFEEANLNRQAFSNLENVGKYKAEVIREELLKINPRCAIEIALGRIQDIAEEKFEDIDYIIDAVDDPQTKIFICELGTKRKLPVLHGACAGWYGQVGWFMPGNNSLKTLYGNQTQGIEKDLKNPVFTPNAISAVMVAEFVKMIKKSDATCINQLLLIDLFDNSVIKTGVESAGEERISWSK